MADIAIDKKQKLANTRKRFKELQELKKKRTDAKSDNDQPNSAQSSSRNTPVDVVEEVALTALKDKQEDTAGDETAPPVLPNYFSGGDAAAAFFDSIPVKDEDVALRDSSSLLTYFNTARSSQPCSIEAENIGLPKYFDNTTESAYLDNPVTTSDTEYHLFPKGEESSTSPIEPDAVCVDYPEIEEHASQMRQLAVHSQESAPKLHPSTSVDDQQKLLDYLGTTGASAREKNNICQINEEIDNSNDTAQREVQHNVENLKQLSNQLAQMMEPDYEYSSNESITDLEKRNIELAANLDREKLQNEQLRSTNALLQERISQLEAERPHQENSVENAHQIAQLKSELQAHLQTIGLLVAEKTELSANLSQYELKSKEKISECEELQARLKASRSRVADLERESGVLKEAQLHADDLEQRYSSTLETLKQEYKALKNQKDELMQDLLEVREKLKNVAEENVKLQQELQEVTGKLSLSEIKIQQLTSGSDITGGGELERLAEEKFALQNDLSNLNQMLKSVIKERDESTVQFQQYAQQLNAQLANLSAKLEQLQHEKEALVVQEQNRVKHIGLLEKQMQDLQNDQMAFATRQLSNPELKSELEKLKEAYTQLQLEKTSAQEHYTKVCNEKDLLLKELEARNDSITQLESMVEQLRGNQPDSVKLLATMESDKVAASRAIQQNKELKEQLESMQEVLKKLDDDKVVLTENLKAQQQTNKELVEKLQKTESSLQSMADAIEIKDHELTRLRESSMHHEQIEDRLRHYEANDNSAHYLQHELLDAKQKIAKLTNEINSFKKEETTTVEHTPIENGKREEENGNHIEIAEEVKDNETLDKENVMKCLEEKVKRTMQEIADLSDEKQRLEHIVLQLQGETETIGEYVALYQHQRMVLKQRAVEKDLQLKQLAVDREQIKIKLDRLNELIKKVVDVPADILEDHHKINKEIGEMKDTNKSNAAEEIITLLSEIKTSNLVEPDEDFHHCPWCSGQLMTV